MDTKYTDIKTSGASLNIIVCERYKLYEFLPLFDANALRIRTIDQDNCMLTAIHLSMDQILLLGMHYKMVCVNTSGSSLFVAAAV